MWSNHHKRVSLSLSSIGATTRLFLIFSFFILSVLILPLIHRSIIVHSFLHDDRYLFPSPAKPNWLDIRFDDEEEEEDTGSSLDVTLPPLPPPPPPPPKKKPKLIQENNTRYFNLQWLSKTAISFHVYFSLLPFLSNDKFMQLKPNGCWPHYWLLLTMCSGESLTVLKMLKSVLPTVVSPL